MVSKEDDDDDDRDDEILPKVISSEHEINPEVTPEPTTTNNSHDTTTTITTSTKTTTTTIRRRVDPTKNENVATTITVSPLATTLVEARRVLWNGNSYFFIPFMNGIRQYVLDPSLAIGSVFWPAVIPRSCHFIVAKIGVEWTCLPLLRIIYGSTQHGTTITTTIATTNSRHVMKTSATAAATAASASILHQPKVVVALKPPSDFQSAFIGAVSFGISAMTDIIGILTHPKKCQGWMEALSQFNTFLQSTGVGDELYEGIQKPLLRGRLLDNFKILNDIQEQYHSDRITQTLLVTDKEISNNNTEKENMRLIRDLKEGHKWMRFATAAYGTEMIKSAIDRESEMSSFDDPRDAIACHTQLLRSEDICLLYDGTTDTKDHEHEHEHDDNHSMHVLHHFVALDHTDSAVVLAIRGTLDVSGTIVDIQGMAVDYCSGKAHKGISEMATNIWKHSGNKICQLLEDYKDYKLVVTGHSLGAGTSCLLTIQIYMQELVKSDRHVECYAFAPPPTYFPCGDGINNNNDDDDASCCSIRLQKAMQNTVAYIHDNDVVPFLSVSSIRRMASFLDAIDNETEHLWFWKRWRIFYEYDDIPLKIVKSVLASEQVQHRHVDGECQMMIPAHRIIWCQDKKDGSYQAFVCDPYKVAECDVFMCPDMLSDHLPEQYEDALDALVEDADADANKEK